MKNGERRPLLARAAWAVALAAAVAGAVYAAGRLWPRALEIRPEALLPQWSRTGGADRLSMPNRFLVAELTRYEDEFFAYLMYTYLGGARELRGGELLLTYREQDGRIVYPLRFVLPNDLVSAIPELAMLRKRGLARDVSWEYLTSEALDRLRGNRACSTPPTACRPGAVSKACRGSN
jgi:hypothetical protein